jgi:hypothetical protein
MSQSTQPWASGPGEILKHGLSLLKKDSDMNRRLAMISIDNAVELMIKTYLGLPKRVTGINISRKDFAEIAESFPRLLDAIAKHASSQVNGIDLGDIEWYHRLRNQLYHNGNGLTVERDKVEVYSQLARALFQSLFGFALIEDSADHTELLGRFISGWVAFQKALENLAFASVPKKPARRIAVDMMQYLLDAGTVTKTEFNEINQLRTIRNEVVHGASDYRHVLNDKIVRRLEFFVKELQSRTPGNEP